jgi:isopentenyl-diphosphate delta-isomerase
MIDEVLIIVNEDDEAIGCGNKMQIHRDGVLHRAFSIFVFDSRGRMLLQQRAANKYHSGGLWSNTCCGHPRHGEDTRAAARRRLIEEMGFDCELEEVDVMVYRAPVSVGLIEHEYDHLLVGQFDGNPFPDPEEAYDWVWVEIDHLLARANACPDAFTVWFRRILAYLGSAGVHAWKVRALTVGAGGPP